MAPSREGGAEDKLRAAAPTQRLLAQDAQSCNEAVGHAEIIKTAIPPGVYTRPLGALAAATPQCLA